MNTRSMMTERQRLEKEINEVSLLQIGYRQDGYHVRVTTAEQASFAKWKASLQARRRSMMTADEIAAEDSLPF